VRRPASRREEFVPRGKERLRRKIDGQYITPTAVAQELGRYAAVDLAEVGHQVPQGGVLDPACGDGVFFEVALRWRWAGSPAECRGVDLDGDVLDGPPGAELSVADGLVDDGRRYGMVIGNPPFGGRGVRERTSEQMRGLARHSEVWRCDKEGRPRRRKGEEPTRIELDRLRRYPASSFFAERFVRAARPGGVLAILLPESFFSSSRDAAARAWVLRHARLVSVTSVHGRDFLRSGTRARTAWSVWIRRDEALPRALDAAGIDPAVILRQPRDETDHELVAASGSRSFVVRVGVPTLLRHRRFDPRYHDPQWEDPLRSCRLPMQPLGDFVDDIVYGALGRGKKPVLQEGPGGFVLVGQKAVQDRGVDLSVCPRIVDEKPFVQERYTLRPGDLVVPRSGMGTLGKNKMTRWDGLPPESDARGAVVDCFDDRVVIRGISSAWVLGVLRTEPGWSQIRRVISGVAQPNLSFTQLRALRMPVPGPEVQAEAERRWGLIAAGEAEFETLRELVRSTLA